MVLRDRAGRAGRPCAMLLKSTFWVWNARCTAVALMACLQGALCVCYCPGTLGVECGGRIPESRSRSTTDTLAFHLAVAFACLFVRRTGACRPRHIPSLPAQVSRTTKSGLAGRQVHEIRTPLSQDKWPYSAMVARYFPVVKVPCSSRGMVARFLCFFASF